MQADHVVKQGQREISRHSAEFVHVHILCQQGDSFRPGEDLEIEQLVFRIPQSAG